jgi:uncharacterized protein with FMN-binding domain
MRRIAAWLLGTLTGLVFLFGYHTSTAGTSGSVTTGSAITSEPAATSGDRGASTVPGATVQTPYGPIQVQLKVASDGTITAVSVPVYPAAGSTDQEISHRALPILIQETLDAQSAQVDMVSGATYTSAGYRQSLQSALDQGAPLNRAGAS